MIVRYRISRRGGGDVGAGVIVGAPTRAVKIYISSQTKKTKVVSIKTSIDKKTDSKNS